MLQNKVDLTKVHSPRQKGLWTLHLLTLPPFSGENQKVALTLKIDSNINGRQELLMVISDQYEHTINNYNRPLALTEARSSELVQLKLNIESSVGDSTSFAAKCFYWEGGSAILSTGDYRHRSRVRGPTPT